MTKEFESVLKFMETEISSITSLEEMELPQKSAYELDDATRKGIKLLSEWMELPNTEGVIPKIAKLAMLAIINHFIKNQLESDVKLSTALQIFEKLSKLSAKDTEQLSFFWITGFAVGITFSQDVMESKD